MTLEVRPITLRDACTFVGVHHRHNAPPRGHKFSVGLYAGDDLVGVAIAGRPVARALDDGRTLEVTRTCTNGHPNANSMLYGAVRRCAWAMGYRRVVTYTQEGESGTSLRAAGFVCAADLEARGSWADCSVKLREIRNAIGAGGVARRRWEVLRR